MCLARRHVLAFAQVAIWNLWNNWIRGWWIWNLGKDSRKAVCVIQGTEFSASISFFTNAYCMGSLILGEQHSEFFFFLGGGGDDTHELCFSGILLTSFRHSYFYQKAIKILHYKLCCQWIFKKSHTYEQISWETTPLCPLLWKTSVKKCSNIWLSICVL